MARTTYKGTLGNSSTKISLITIGLLFIGLGSLFEFLGEIVLGFIAIILGVAFLLNIIYLHKHGNKFKIIIVEKGVFIHAPHNRSFVNYHDIRSVDVTADSLLLTLKDEHILDLPYTLFNSNKDMISCATLIRSNAEL